MLILQYALNQPGFWAMAAGVDTSRNAFSPFPLFRALEDGGAAWQDGTILVEATRGASRRRGAEVHYRIGQTVTFTKLIHLKTLLMFTGKIIEVPKVRRATSEVAALNWSPR